MNFEMSSFSCRVKLVAPVIAPCGHTFEYANICQRLEKSRTCPLDFNALTTKDLRNNYLVKNVTSLLDDIVPIFVSSHEQAPIFPHAWERSSKEYPVFLEQIKQFNVSLQQQVVNQKLDDRHIIQQTLTCPISKEILSNPVVGSCGHTFDESSFFLGVKYPYSKRLKCPHDETFVSVEDSIPNIVIKNFLPKMKGAFSSLFCNLTHSKAINGCWLFLNKNSTVKRVEQILKQLGFYQEKPESSLLFVTDENSSFGSYHNLRDYPSTLEIDPVLRRVN